MGGAGAGGWLANTLSHVSEECDMSRHSVRPTLRQDTGVAVAGWLQGMARRT